MPLCTLTVLLVYVLVLHVSNLVHIVGGVRIFHVALQDTNNIGDVYASPLKYFPELESVITEILCVDANTPEEIATRADLRKDDITIIGGGGLLGHSDRWNFALKYYCERTTCMLWAPGRNRHHSHSLRSFAHSTEEILSLAAVSRTRDFRHPDEPLPMLDSSCLLPGLSLGGSNPRPPPSRTVGFYLHAKLSELRRVEVEAMLREVSAEDVLFNNELDIDTVLDFMRQHEVIVTSSYHGVLWATYLNIPVYTVFDFSEKFSHFPFPLRKYSQPESEGGEGKENGVLGSPVVLPRDLLVNGTLLKHQCMTDNLEFYSTYLEPFVRVLRNLAFSTPLTGHAVVPRIADCSGDSGDTFYDGHTQYSVHGSCINRGAGGSLRLGDFNMRSVVAATHADCSPLRRNHIYDRPATPMFEANLFVELDASFAMLLLQLHDHEEQEASVGPPQDRPALLVTVRSGQEGEAYQAIDFTDYIIKTVASVRSIRDKPSVDYTSSQFSPKVTLVLGLLDLEAGVTYTVKAVALNSEEVFLDASPLLGEPNATVAFTCSE